MNEADETKWSDAPIQYVDIPVCQFCGASEFIRIRTEAAGNGEFSRKLICKSCSRKNLVVYELPETGKYYSAD